MLGLPVHFYYASLSCRFKELGKGRVKSPEFIFLFFTCMCLVTITNKKIVHNIIFRDPIEICTRHY